MADLKRPGRFEGVSQRLLEARVDLDGKLWAFDHRGRPIDPGAVAAWWRALADAFATGTSTLWAEGMAGAEQRTAAVDDARTLHLVGMHQVAPDLDLDLVTTNATGTGQVRRADDAEATTLTLPRPGGSRRACTPGSRTGW
jgi:hypothetical protein